MIKIFKKIVYKIQLLYWKWHYRNIYLCDCLTIHRLEHCLKLLNIWEFEINENIPTFGHLTVKINQNISQAQKEIIKGKIYKQLPVGIAFCLT